MRVRASQLLEYFWTIFIPSELGGRKRMVFGIRYHLGETIGMKGDFFWDAILEVFWENLIVRREVVVVV